VQRCPDISQAKALLDWQPRTALRPGLQRTITYFDELLGELAEKREPATVG
jgi:UDP-glucuronate decarboxylase